MTKPGKKASLIVVTGPTASGKTAFAAHLAYDMNGEIISADSRQVYKEMDIGTGKDYKDYFLHGSAVASHLIDIREPGYKYNVYEFQNDFQRVYKDIINRGKTPILAGGTGLYIEAVLDTYQLTAVPVNEPLRASLMQKSQEQLVDLLKQMNPTLHNTSDTVHRKRTIRAIEIAEYTRRHPAYQVEHPEITPVILGVKYDRMTRRRMITERLQQRLESGMIEEVSRLLKKVKAEDLIYYGLEYKFITLFLKGSITREQMFVKLETAIHQFAKRQMTWFRKMERNGHQIHWLDGHLTMNEKLEQAKIVLSNFQFPD